jgi:hypothetical protein
MSAWGRACTRWLEGASLTCKCGPTLSHAVRASSVSPGRARVRPLPPRRQNLYPSLYLLPLPLPATVTPGSYLLLQYSCDQGRISAIAPNNVVTPVRGLPV